MWEKMGRKPLLKFTNRYSLIRGDWIFGTEKPGAKLVPEYTPFPEFFNSLILDNMS